MADLVGRIARVTASIPVTTPGDFTNVQTNDVVEIGGDSSDPADLGNRIAFKITKTSEKQPNTSEIKIYNLSPDTRAKLQKKGVKVMLEAGYRTTGLTRLFIGDLRTCDPVREGADWISTLKLGDGERSFRFAQLNESFAPGTKAADVLRRLANATGLDLGNTDDAARGLDVIFDSGYVVAGGVQSALARLCKSLNRSFSVQDGRIQILKPGEVLDLPVPDITIDSGMVGSPEMGSPEKKGQPALLKIKSLLIPTQPGGKVHIKSEKYDGFVRVKKVTFSGDIAGGEWYTEIEGVNLGQ